MNSSGRHRELKATKHMRVKVIYINPETAEESLENIRHLDEIGDDRNWTDEDFDKAEHELKTQGRFWVDADRYIKPARD
jgi:hypothetical protein